jgi:hypothetical protein
MKHTSPNQTGQGVIDAKAPEEQTENRSKSAVDTVIEEIHERAEFVGSVLEEILQTGRKHVNSDKHI